MKLKLIEALLISTLLLAACGNNEVVIEEQIKEEIIEQEIISEAQTAETEEVTSEESIEEIEEVEGPVEENLSTEDSIKKFINNSLGKETNMGKPTIEKVSLIDGSLSIELNGNDNLTIGFIRDGMLSDAKKVLEHVKVYEDVTDDVFIAYLFDMVDSYGNTKPIIVLNMRFTQETINNINFDGFSYKNLELVADNFYLHQAFK